MTTPGNRLATSRDNAGRFAKGVTGNPGGRPRGLASYIREQTLNGEELANFVLMVFKGKMIDCKKPSTAMRMEAATWLSDRGFGRPVQGVEHIDVIHHAQDIFRDVPTEELRAWVEAQTKALNGANVIEGEARALESRAKADD